VLAVSVLARPEGALLLLLAISERLLRSGRRDRRTGRMQRTKDVWIGLGLAALVLVPVGLFHLAVGGSLLPTTFQAKAGGDFGGLSVLRDVHLVFGIFLQALPVAALLAGGGVAVLAERGIRGQASLLPAAWVIALPLAYSLLTPSGRPLLTGNFGRYYFPLIPFVALLAAVALERPSVALAGRWAGTRLRLCAPLLAALLLAPAAPGLVRGAARYAQNVLNVQNGDVRMALWLRDRLSPEAVLAVNDIGAVKYYLPNRVLDLVGIASPEIHGYVKTAVAGGGSRRGGILGFLAAQRPDYLLVFPDWLPGLQEEGFTPLLELEIPDNITLGRDRLMLFATPWTRFPLDIRDEPTRGMSKEG
jgi:hypothetical protein